MRPGRLEPWGIVAIALSAGPGCSASADSWSSDVGDAAAEGGRLDAPMGEPSPDAGTGEGGMPPTAGDAGGLPPVAGDEIFVATNGDDANPGTKAQPLKTIAAAQAKVRAHPDRGTVPITVTVLPGTYYVGKTIVFTSADSGSQAAPVTYRGGGTATLSGGAPLQLTWTPYKNGIMQASVPGSVSVNLSFDVLFLDGQRQRMARYPNYQAGAGAFGGGSADAVSQTHVGGWMHPPSSNQPGYLHGLHAQRWGSEHYVIQGVDSSQSLQTIGPLCNGRPDALADGTQVVENVFDELDVPNEWYFDRGGCCGTAGTLYFYPPAGVDLTNPSSYTLEVAGIERIFEFDGGCGAAAAPTSPPSECASSEPVQWVTLDGFHYTDTSRTFAQCNETLLRSDWNIYRGGTVFVTGGEHVTISNGFFDQLGGAGVFVNGYDTDVAVTGNRFVDTGTSAILFIGSNKAVRNALIGYGTASVPVGQLDMTPGPQTNDYPRNCSATENLIHDIGDPVLQVAGVGIDMAQDITVSHNSIYNTPRAGINVGDGCWGGHVISYNDVFATVLYTGDHGSFNSWGRDRYWDYGTGAIESRVGTDPKGLPLLDVVKPITLANNRWRCDNGWDVDLDDGSTNFVITNNVFLSGGLKWREGYDRTGDNNVFVKQDSTPCAPGGPSTSGCLSAHVWPTDNNDVFTHNIFWGYDPISPDAYGKQLDYNLFQSASALSAAHGYGVDMNSASGDPGFLDAANGDFQLPTTSVALALGITSLPADTYGVTTLSLRAQAAIPPFGPVSLGAVSTDAGVRDCSTQATWRGATVENLCGLNELTVVGLGSDVGVFVPAVPAGSQAATDGFEALDVILAFAGQQVASLDDLNRFYAATASGQRITVGIHRSQMDTSLMITR